MNLPKTLRTALLAGVLFNGDRVLPPAPEPPPRAVAARDIVRALAELPPRTEGRGSLPGDPLNLIFWGTEIQVREALTAGGWTELPVPYTASVRAGLKDLLSGRGLHRFPPMTVYHVLGRPQDMNWARVITPVLRRHHFRLWRTGLTDGTGREIWWGSGNYDLSVRWTDLTHRPDPNMNEERDYIKRSLEKIKEITNTTLIELPQIPLRGSNECGYPFRTDGKALWVEFAAPGRAGSGSGGSAKK